MPGIPWVRPILARWIHGCFAFTAFVLLFEPEQAAPRPDSCHSIQSEITGISAKQGAIILMDLPQGGRRIRSRKTEHSSMASNVFERFQTFSSAASQTECLCRAPATVRTDVQQMVTSAPQRRPLGSGPEDYQVFSGSKSL